ncbi:Protein farnesyltransferase subunit beta [Mycena kentingensis (nom. inval.)]|nr:Protein farnesyltransferase subunit beta [Mycena kentingensis (nom. inval.)]
MTATMRPVPVDAFPTITSTTQAETERVLFEHRPAECQPPMLDKKAHMNFLVRDLVQGFPARYTSQDASQPWLIFWTLQSFSILQVGLDPGNKQRAIDMLMACQHPGGGFGGGPKQAAHLLPTYAAVCALAIVGRAGDGGGWDQIDRTKMYEFFMSLKQPDGSFFVSKHSEVDVRGIYCLLVVATLLDIITPELVEGTAAFIASCQTYEGGFSSASQPYYSPNANGPSSLLGSPRPPLGEAHGGYTFCALAAWVMLQPFLPSTSQTNPSIDTKALVRWLVQMQGIPVELGGFKGRTNKLVDGCYSWWVGGAFGLLESIGINPAALASQEAPTPSEGDWDDIDDSLYNRKALQEYILCAGQHPAGGLRDKPPKCTTNPSFISGLILFLEGLTRTTLYTVFPAYPLRNTRWRLPSEKQKELESVWSGDNNDDGLRRRVFAQSLCFMQEEGTEKLVGGSENRVNATHPIFNLTVTHTDGIMAHFYKQPIPERNGGRKAA